MTVLLARPPIEAHTEPKDPYAWYARALVEGFGIAIPLPQGNQDMLDRAVGLFANFLGRRFGRQLFLAVVAQGEAPENDLTHAREMLALFPNQTKLVVEAEGWFEIDEEDLMHEVRFNELKRKIKQVREKNNKTFVAYHTPASVSEESFAQTVEKIVSLAPDFFVTNRPRHARGLMGETAPTPFRRFWDSRPLWYLRTRVSRFRFLMRVGPLYGFIYLLESLTGNIITIHTRPLYAKDYSLVNDSLVAMPSTAIMMQGPIMYKRNYTLETLAMYKKEFPSTKIIISTWEDEPKEIIEKMRSLGADVVTSKKPEWGGPGNTNMQLTSARAGLVRAKELGVEYTVKTRTDIRIYNHLALEMMLNLLKQFPPSERSNQRARLIFGTGSTSHQPYQMGEFVFGAVEDVLDYYSAPLIPKGTVYENYLVEMYIPTNFLKKKGWDLEWTIPHGWQVYRECFLALDWSMLDLYWYKYFHFRNWEYQNQRPYKRSVPPNFIVKFDDWINIFTDYENKKLRPEQKLLFTLVPRTEDLD